MLVLIAFDFTANGILPFYWEPCDWNQFTYQQAILLFTILFFILPQNKSNTKKQDNHTKANKSGEEAQEETMGLIDIGLPQSKK